MLESHPCTRRSRLRRQGGRVAIPSSHNCAEAGGGTVVGLGARVRLGSVVPLRRSRARPDTPSAQALTLSTSPGSFFPPPSPSPVTTPPPSLPSPQGNCIHASDDTDDGEEHALTVAALDAIGVAGEDKEGMYALLDVMLQLGNLDFSEQEAAGAAAGE